MLSGFFEGFWILTRSDEQWAEYLEALKKPRYYLDPLVARSYVYPVGIVGFLWGVSVPGLGALGLLLPLAV